MPPPEDLGPDEELVAGRRPVEEAFVARRPAIRLLVVPQRRPALEKLVLHATNLRIPIVEVEGGSLTALAGFDGHQGIALVVEPRRFASLDDVLARAAERAEPPFVLVLDSLEDPHNVGTLLRSAEAAGVHGVLFPTHRQAPLSPS
ncbi:MAG: TrmH family RNA methyltransferase, partial [Candidatus Limnocylindrales bacterium]